MIIILRIYEVRGPIADNAQTLSRRSGLTVKRVNKALDQLFESGKLITSEGLISNPHAERFLSDHNEKQNERKQIAKVAAEVRWQKSEKKQRNVDASRMHSDAYKEKEEDKEKNLKKENAKPGVDATPKKAKGSRADRADRATRIPEDWALTPEMGNYGRSRGLTTAEVKLEAEKFIRYWRGKGGEKGRKLDWKSTWENWCISTAERLGRKPRNADGSIDATNESLDRQAWETVAVMYKNTNNWKRTWGPEPGDKDCQMPPDLLKQFVNQELTPA
jgi:hypothetical protein